MEVSGERSDLVKDVHPSRSPMETLPLYFARFLSNLVKHPTAPEGGKQFLAPQFSAKL